MRAATVFRRPAGVVAAGWLIAASVFWLPVWPRLVTTEDHFFNLRDPLGMLTLMTASVGGLVWWSERRRRRDDVVVPGWTRAAVAGGTVALWTALVVATTSTAEAHGVAVVLAVLGALALAVGTGAARTPHALVWMCAAGWALVLVFAAYQLIVVAPGFELEPGACFSGMDCIGYSSPQYEVTIVSFLFVPLCALPALVQVVALALVTNAGSSGEPHR